MTFDARQRNDLFLSRLVMMIFLERSKIFDDHNIIRSYSSSSSSQPSAVSSSFNVLAEKKTIEKLMQSEMHKLIMPLDKSFAEWTFLKDWNWYLLR